MQDPLTGTNQGDPKIIKLFEDLGYCSCWDFDKEIIWSEYTMKDPVRTVQIQYGINYETLKEFIVNADEGELPDFHLAMDDESYNILLDGFNA